MECEEIQIEVFGEWSAAGRRFPTDVTDKLRNSNPKLFLELIKAIEELEE